MFPGESLLSKFIRLTSFTSVSTITNPSVLGGFLHALRFIFLSLFPFTAIIWHNEADFQLCPDFM